MIRQRLAYQLVSIVWLFILVGCGAPATPIPSTPTPGVGVPVKSENWEITMTGVREVKSYGNATPKNDYAFLVIDVKIRTLSPENIAISTEMATIFDETGLTQKADGGNLSNECIGCLSMMKIPDVGQANVNFVFILPAAKIQESFKFQFEDVPPIHFALK